MSLIQPDKLTTRQHLIGCESTAYHVLSYDTGPIESLLGKVSKRAIKMITGFSQFKYEDRLLWKQEH